MNHFRAQTFDYFLVLDFEATCCENGKLEPGREIIEFPVLKVSGQTFEVEATFHRYVRPTANPTLTPFCTSLTGITQWMVDRADTFSTVFDDFKRWMKYENLVDSWEDPKKKFTFVTCGNSDLRDMLPTQAKLSNDQIPIYMRDWIDAKSAFYARYSRWTKSQNDMIDYLQIVKVGREHSGIDDCRNLLQIIREIAKNYVFENNQNFRNRGNYLQLEDLFADQWM